MKYLFWLFIIYNGVANAQKISGYVYNSEGIIPYFKLENATKELVVETDQDGKFSMSASLGDSIRFSSINYDTYIFIVKKKHFEETVVVELKTNSLEEVNPISYRPGNGNLLEVPRYLARLLFPKKKKEQINTKATYPLRFEHFEAIFKSDELFNTEFLTNELLIPKKYHNMFFNYLQTKNYTSALLEENQTLDFIERLQESAREYREEVLSKQ